MLTVGKNTQLYKGVVFLEPLVYRVRYWTWFQGIIPNVWGAYADNEHRPDRAKLRRQLLEHGVFCQGVPTIILRFAGYEIPTKGNPEYDGGIYAAWGGNVGLGWQQGYYSDVAVDFDAERAAAWAAETRSGVLLGTPFEGAQLNMQGHTAVVLPSSYILQSDSSEGLNWSRTVYQEIGYWSGHRGKMVHPSKWIELQGQLRKERLAPWARAA